MYPPSMFKSDGAGRLAFAEARGFGTVCAWDGVRPIASSLPFYLTSADDGTPHAAFHVARHNPLAKLADGKTPWLMAGIGAGAYVSPDWYVSPDQGPTWLYQAVHPTRTVPRLPDAELGPHLDLLSPQFESRLPPKPPRPSAAPRGPACSLMARLERRAWAFASALACRATSCLRALPRKSARMRRQSGR